MQEQVGKVTVTESKEGGSLYITTRDGTVYASILLEQSRYQFIKGQGVLNQRRYTELVDDLPRLLSLKLRPGDSLPGNIVMKMQITPVDAGNPDLFKMTNLKGEVLLDEWGNEVWVRSYYTEDVRDEDDFILSL